jgi:hypothetical protein
MKQRPWLIVPVLLAAGLLAFFLQGIVRFILVTPLADLWWMLTVFYRSIPQTACWLMLLVLAVMIAVGSLSGLFNGGQPKRSRHRHDRGPVEDLAWFIGQKKRSRYFRWHVARQLGRLAAEILARSDQPADGSIPNTLAGKEWQPPDAIQRYLEAGLKRYESPGRGVEGMMHKDQTLEVDPQDVVAYLETQMEKRSGRKYS